MSSYSCSHHDTHQNGCLTCDDAKDYYDREAKIEALQQENERLEIENVALREIIEQSGVDADELLEASGDE